jgi:hypothetical protein
VGDEIRKLWQTGHYRPVWLGLGIALPAPAVFYSGGSITKLPSWAFVVCFLSIGLSTRFRDLMTFGLKPFWAFTIGVIVNVPLGYFLSTVVFSKYWSAISRMM